MAISNENPYAPPQAEGLGYAAAKNSLRWIVARFRAECRALCGAALFFSLSTGWISFVLRSTHFDFLSTLFAGLSATLLAVGFSILLKKMWAVRIFLLFNWPMALLSILLVIISGRVIIGLILFAAFFAVVFALAAAQCHRVLGWSRQIRAAGYPLTVRSDDVAESSYSM